MMETAQIALAGLGVPKDRIHLELFTPGIAAALDAGGARRRRRKRSAAPNA